MGHQCRFAAYRPGQVVGGVEHPLPAAPVDREGVTGGRTPVPVGEVGSEIEDVAGGGPSPAVDGLARVADSRHRMPPASRRIRAGEQPAQQGGLRRGRVLVLVQQHHGELRPQRRRDGRYLGRQSRCRGHLVGELDVAQVGLQLLVAHHEGGQLQALRSSGSRHLQRRVHLSARVAGSGAELRVEGLRMIGKREGVDEVGPEFTGQLQQPLRHRRRAQPGQVLQAGGVGHNARSQAEPGGAGDQPRITFDAEPQPVLGHQPSREGVVGEDQLLAGL